MLTKSASFLKVSVSLAAAELHVPVLPQVVVSPCSRVPQSSRLLFFSSR
jgi:hypothetical protein